MQEQVKILAILHIVFSALGLAAALIVMAVFGGIAGIVHLSDACLLYTSPSPRDCS